MSNGGRSLAGKVLTEHYAEGAVEVRSAGSEQGHVQVAAHGGGNGARSA